MNCWLVIDLTENRFAAAILDTSKEKVNWIKKPVRIYPRPDVYDYVYESDLAFFHRPGEKSWFPTRVETLNKLPKDYESIPALFTEEKERLREIFPQTLAALINGLLNEYKTLPLIFLVDHEDNKPLLHEFSTKIQRNSSVYLRPHYPGDIEGFALLNTEQPSFPPEKSFVTCEIDKNGGEPEIRQFQWTNLEFRQVEGKLEMESRQSRWSSLRDLQRAGRVLFCLVWQERVQAELNNKIALAESEKQALSQILIRMNEVIRQLGESLIPV